MDTKILEYNIMPITLHAVYMERTAGLLVYNCYNILYLIYIISIIYYIHYI